MRDTHRGGAQRTEVPTEPALWRGTCGQGPRRVHRPASDTPPDPRELQYQGTAPAGAHAHSASRRVQPGRAGPCARARG